MRYFSVSIFLLTSVDLLLFHIHPISTNLGFFFLYTFFNVYWNVFTATVIKLLTFQVLGVFSVCFIFFSRTQFQEAFEKFTPFLSSN